jgi:capsular exopolysaccharide synthesis family protein
MKALRRRWAMACFLGILVAVGIGLGLWFGIPEGKYTGSSVLYVPIDPPKVVYTQRLNPQDFTIFQQAQKAMVKSRMVLNAALRDPEVRDLSFLRTAEDPIEYLQTKLKVDYSTGPEFLTVQLTEKDKAEVTKLIDAVTQAYLKEVVGNERLARNTRLDHLKDAIQKYSDILATKRKTFKELQKSVGSKNADVLAAKQRYLIEVAGKARNELAPVEFERKRLQVEVEFAEADAAAGKDPTENIPVPENLVEQEIHKDPGMLRLLTHKAELEAELAEDKPKVVGGDKSPLLQAKQQRLAALEKSIEDKRNYLRPIITKELRDHLRVDQASILGAKRQRIRLLKQLEKIYKEDMSTFEGKSDDINVVQAELDGLAQQIAQEQKTADQLAAEEEALKVEQMAPPRVRLWQEPAASRPDEMLRKLKITIPASCAALFMVVGLISWTEYRRRRLESAHDVHVLGMNLIGTVPARPSSSAWLSFRQLPVPVWESLMTECVDAVRTRLLHAADTQGLRVVMVTSAVPGEGKTSVSTQLAASLARAGRKTLLIDGDLRRPAAHRVYEIEEEPGLCEFLRGQVGLPDILRQTGVDKLHMIPAGLWDQQAIQVLAGNDLAALLARLREEYDIIVVDSAPVLPVVDALLIGRHVDGVLFSLMRGVSQLPTVESAHHRLTALNIPLLGAVVNGADLGGYRYDYAYSRSRRDFQPPPLRPATPPPAEDEEANE